MARRLYYATDGRMRPLMNLVRVAGGWGLEADGRITRELLADAFELVGRTDDTLQAKTNPFEMATFTDEACPEEAILRWNWLAVMVAWTLWDDEGAHALCARALEASPGGPRRWPPAERAQRPGRPPRAPR